MKSFNSRRELPASVTVLIPLVAALAKEKRLRPSRGTIRLRKPTSCLVPALSVMTPGRMPVAVPGNSCCPAGIISLSLSIKV